MKALQNCWGSHCDGVRKAVSGHLLSAAVAAGKGDAEKVEALPADVRSTAAAIRGEGASKQDLGSVPSRVLLMTAILRPSADVAKEAIRRFCRSTAFTDAVTYGQILTTLHRLDAAHLKLPGLPCGGGEVAKAKEALVAQVGKRKKVTEAHVVAEIKLAVALLGAGAPHDALAVMSLAHVDILRYAGTVLGEGDKLMDEAGKLMDSGAGLHQLQAANRKMRDALTKTRKGMAIMGLDLDDQLSTLRQIGSIDTLKARLLSAQAEAEKEGSGTDPAEMLARALKAQKGKTFPMDEAFVEVMVGQITAPPTVAGEKASTGALWQLRYPRRRDEALQFLPYAKATDALLATVDDPFHRPLVHSLTLNPRLETKRVVALLAGLLSEQGPRPGIPGASQGSGSPVMLTVDS